MIDVCLTKSTLSGKKYMVKIKQKNGNCKIVHFGASGYSDYTKHKDKERKERYIARHKKRENWTKTGVTTAGFWSRWLLWNKPSLYASKKDIEKRFLIKFKKSIQS